MTELKRIIHGCVTLHRHKAGLWRCCFMCVNILLLSLLIETHFTSSAIQIDDKSKSFLDMKHNEKVEHSLNNLVKQTMLS